MPFSSTFYKVLTGFLILAVLVVLWLNRFLLSTFTDQTSKNFLTNFTTKKPSATQTSLDTSNWKTYTNTSYKYSINYPNDWTVIDRGQLEPKIPSFIVFNPNTAASNDLSITISYSTRSYQELLSLGSNGNQINVASISGTEETQQDSSGNITLEVILPLKTNVLIISSKKQYEDIFNKMLSSLKISN